MRLAVVGGGMAGLAAAWEAERIAAAEGLDLEIVLHEASDRVGGKIRTIREDGYVVEAGADALVRYKPWALDLVREAGLADEIVEALPAPPASIIHDGEALPLPKGLNVVVPTKLGSLARSPLLSPRGKLRVLADLVLPRGPAGDQPLGALVSRRLGRELWERLAAPLVGGVYGGEPAEISATAAFPQLLELERRHRSLLLGSRRALRERQSSGIRGALFASLASGLERLPECVAGRLDRTELRLGAHVERLDQLEAEAVVIATPAFAAAVILADAAPAAADELAAIRYSDAISVTLAFPAARFPALSGHGVLFAAGEGSRLRGFTWVDRKWPDRAPVGRRLVRAFLRSEEEGLTDAELAELAVRELAALTGPVPEPERAWACRWDAALPAVPVGHEERLERLRRALAPLAGVELAGAAYRGVGVADVVRDGREAARRALSGTRLAPSPARN